MTFWGKVVQRIGRFLYYYYSRDLFTGDACSHIAREAHRWCIGEGLDFGAGRWPLAGAKPIDKDTDLQLDCIARGTQNFVFSSHTLEHIPDWRGTMREFHRVLKPGGVLFLYLPHEGMALWNPETRWGRSAGHVWTPRLETLLGYVALNDWKLLGYNPVPDKYWSWFIVLGREE